MDPHSPGGGGRGGVLRGILGGGVFRVRVRVSWLGLDGFRPKNVIFPHSFSDLATWNLCHH